MVKMNDKHFTVTVTDKANTYKVTVKEIETSTTRNTRVGFNPLKLLQGKNLGLRVHAGRKQTTKTTIDNDTMELDKDKWEEQLKKWVGHENFNEEVVAEIKDEIKKIIDIKG